MKLVLITLLSTIISFTYARFFKHADINSQPVQDQDVYWFEEQILNHFVQVPQKYWRQKYIVQNEHFKSETGPLFLYIGGEGATNGISQRSNFTLELAQQYQGIVITLEHRFYGESQPFGYDENSYSIENLKYLTHAQALADLANFIGYLKTNKKFGIHKDTPVITIGGSYPGALSAWFRYNYEHLTIGALASSAVVNAIDDYQQFDYQVRLSVSSQGQTCIDQINNLIAEAEKQVASPSTSAEFKRKFGAEELSNVDFLYFFTDIYALQVQYGGTTYLCNTMLGDKTQEQQMEAFQDYARTKCNPNDYDQNKLKDTEYGYQKNIRQWTYQTCTYFGWFYTAYKKQPFRSTQIDLKYFQDLCQNVYGEDYLPDIPETNLMMGATKMSVKNIIFTNGVQDPWRWASIQKDQPPMQALVVDCVDCAHCVDLSTPKPTDPESLKETQAKVMKEMGEWIAEYWSSKGMHYEL